MNTCLRASVNELTTRVGSVRSWPRLPLLVIILILHSSFLIPHSAQAQDYVRRAPDLDRLTQELFAEIQSDEVPYEDLYETLLQYYQDRKSTRLNSSHSS